MSIRMTAPQPREAGPVWIASGVHYGTSWPALAVTTVTAVAIVAGVATLPRWADALVDRGDTATPAAAAATPPAAPTPAPTAPPAGALASAWVGQSATPVVVVGDTTTLTFRFRNTGTAEWRRHSPSEVRLGIVGPYDPAMAADWPYPERPAVQGEAVVAPGEIATFSFNVLAVQSGTFRFRVRPVVDGVAWLTDEGVYADVEVR